MATEPAIVNPDEELDAYSLLSKPTLDLNDHQVGIIVADLRKQAAQAGHDYEHSSTSDEAHDFLGARRALTEAAVGIERGEYLEGIDEVPAFPAPNLRRHLAWAIVHADKRVAWQCLVYSEIGPLAIAEGAAPELSAAYDRVWSAGPCNWNWHNGYRHPTTAFILGREPAKGERVVDTFNAWIGVDVWPEVLPVPDVPIATEGGPS